MVLEVFKKRYNKSDTRRTGSHKRDTNSFSIPALFHLSLSPFHPSLILSPASTFHSHSERGSIDRQATSSSLKRPSLLLTIRTLIASYHALKQGLSKRSPQFLYQFASGPNYVSSNSLFKGKKGKFKEVVVIKDV